MTFFSPISVCTERPVRVPFSENNLNSIAEQVDNYAAAINLRDGKKWFLDKIRHPVYQELYLQLFLDKPMQAFIEHGDPGVFEQNFIQSSSKDRAYFLFWKPFFLIRLAPIIAECIENNRSELLKRIFQIDLELSEKEENELYGAATKTLDAKIHNLDEALLFDNLANGAIDVLDKIQDIVIVDILNGLPNYFQEQRDAIARRLVELSIYAFNEKEEDALALNIVALAGSLCVSKGLKDLVAKSQEDLFTFVNRKKLIATHQESVHAINDKLGGFRKVFEELPEGKITPTDLLNKVKNDTPLDELKSLPPEFRYFVSEFLVLFRAFASYSWNSRTDYEQAKDILKFSHDNLPLSKEQEKTIKEDIEILKDRFNSYNREKAKYKRRYKEKRAVKRTRDWAVIFLIAVILAAVAAIINNWDVDRDSIVSNSPRSGGSSTWSGGPSSQSGSTSPQPRPSQSSSSTSSSPRGSTAQSGESAPQSGGPSSQSGSRSSSPRGSTTQPGESAPQSGDPSSQSSSTSSSPRGSTAQSGESTPQSGGPSSQSGSTSPQSGGPSSQPIDSSTRPGGNDNIATEGKPSNQGTTSLVTGDSPFNNIFGAGDVSDLHQNWVLFKNESDREVIVCLKDLSSGRFIRNEYIQIKDQLEVRNIPNGEFIVLVHYGLNWSEEVAHNDIDIRGGFQNRSGFCQFIKPQERIELYDINGSFTSLVITFKEFGLESEDQIVISAKDFFDKEK